MWERRRKTTWSKTQALDLERTRPRTLPQRLNVPLDLADEDFDDVEKTDEGESNEDCRDSSLSLCEGTGK